MNGVLFPAEQLSGSASRGQKRVTVVVQPDG